MAQGENHVPSATGKTTLDDSQSTADHSQLPTQSLAQTESRIHPPTLRQDASEYETERPTHVRFSQETVRRPQLPTIHSQNIVPQNADASLQTTARRAGVQSRPRGYSLRRAIFSQNLTKQETPQDVDLELSAPSSSSSQAVQRHNDHKKSEQSIVTIEEELAIYQTPSKDDTASMQHGSIHLSSSSDAFKYRLPSLYSRISSSLASWQERLFSTPPLPPSRDGRHVRINTTADYKQLDERTGKGYISNIIRSCKYTPWNFIPKQLWAQFGKLANFYFLCVSILQMIPGLSTTGTYTTIIPLLIFVSISMAKEGYDDLRRNKLDKEENERAAFVLDAHFMQNRSHTKTESTAIGPDSGVWRKEMWQNVKVGDVLLLERDQPIPADVVLLYAAGSDGAAHVETKGLDGETNLKTKKPLNPLQRRATTESAISELDAEFVVEDPNLDLYRFEGRVTVAGETLPLGLGEVIYRGSVLRNTPVAVGVVVYSGEECKIRMNANKNPRIKAPTLQAKVNRVVMIVAGLVLFIAIAETVSHQIWRREHQTGMWYLHQAQVAFGPILTSFIIMFNTMLPLSLYVSLEIVKVAQMFLMNDIDMYDPESDIPMEARTSTLNEELGQVSYIFSDKTGTLTNNSMKFRKMSVAGTAWLHDHDLVDDVANARERLLHKKRHGPAEGKRKRRHQHRSSRTALVSTDTGTRRSGLGYEEPRTPDVREFLHTGKTDDLLEYIYHRPQSLFARKARFFILCLALCHTAIPEKSDEGDITFQAASPDELALVTAAQELGYIVTDRQTGRMTVKSYQGDSEDDVSYEEYEILEVIEFSSVRKRMSILVRFPDQRICLICKGADTVLRKMLRQADLAETFVRDIKRRTSTRKSIEVQRVLNRRSTQISGRKSAQEDHQIFAPPRRAATMGATVSSVGGRKSSVQLERRGSNRESVDTWLRERERGTVVLRDSSIHYAPRLSETVSPPPPPPPTNITRPSVASFDSPRSSFESENFHDFIDESIVLNDKAIFERCFNHIDDFATEGLRTLVYGHRFVPEADFQEWRSAHHAASTSLVDRQGKIERTAELIERQLELTGATAIEDKLQASVPDAIERFRRAGIKMWMLTGDKRETAINIGHSCHLIKDYSTITILDHEQGDLPDKIQRALHNMSSPDVAHSVLVVDGQTLTFIDCDAVLGEAFARLAIATDSVICCRASPGQKANLVRTVRVRVKGSVTLAIGDGANDIAMIQEAHVGIGIAGKEGLQASRTSDYSIAQFRFLVKLLLVHGRWNYVRVCKYTLGTFWKEMVFYLVQAVFQRFTGFTGTSLYEPWSMSMFNTLFTSLPVIFMGVFEKDLSATTLLAVPELYTYGHQNRGFNIFLYLRWAALGTVESMIVFWMAHQIYGDAPFVRDSSLYPLGTLAFTACITIISLKLQFFELHNKSIMAAIAIFLSVGGWWLFNLVLSGLYNRGDQVYRVYDNLLYGFGRTALWWITLIVIVIVICTLETTTKCVKCIFLPDDVETFQSLERDIEVKRRLEESAAGLLQAGWNRGTKKSSMELLREEEEQARREAEIQEILDRPRTMEMTSQQQSTSNEDVPVATKIRKRMSWTPVDFEGVHVKDYANGEASRPTAATRESVDLGDLMHKGSGQTRKEHQG